MDALDSQVLIYHSALKGLNSPALLYFSLVLISEQTKDLGVLRDLFCHRHFELLRRQGLPLPVDICHFRKPALRPRLPSSSALPPHPCFRLATAWDLLASGSEGSGNLKARGLEVAWNSGRCISLASDKPRRRAGGARKNQAVRTGEQGRGCLLSISWFHQNNQLICLSRTTHGGFSTFFMGPKRNKFFFFLKFHFVSNHFRELFSQMHFA